MGNKFEICIPSYKRANVQRTLDYLERIGTPQEMITISVQTKHDFEAYKASRVDQRVRKIIYREGKCVADNRNTLLDNFCSGTRIVHMEDDVSEISALEIVQGKKRLRTVDTFQEFSEIVEQGFVSAAIYGTISFGLNLCTNPFYMENKVYRTKLCGFGLYGLINTNMRFDNHYILFDDPEFIARIIKRYKAHPVLGKYAAINSSLIERREHRKQRIAGGCTETWEKNPNIRADMLKLIKREHGNLFDIFPEKDNCISIKKAIAKKLN